jgi:hypothetical protein
LRPARCGLDGGWATEVPHDLIERVAAAALAVALVGISFWIDFRHFIVVASVSTTTYDNYELFIFAWEAAALAFACSRWFTVVYLVLTAALIGHAYFWLFIEFYLLAISVTKTFGALMTLVIANAIALLRNESWRDVAMLNATIAAAASPQFSTSEGNMCSPMAILAGVQAGTGLPASSALPLPGRRQLGQCESEHCCTFRWMRPVSIPGTIMAVVIVSLLRRGAGSVSGLRLHFVGRSAAPVDEEYVRQLLLCMHAGCGFAGGTYESGDQG